MVNELNFYYGSARALSNVSLDVQANQITALIGPSGCGKTTILKMIGGLYSHETKNVDISGIIKINNLSPIEARRNREFGFAFQNPVLLPWRNVRENIILPLDIIGNDDGVSFCDPEKLIDLVGLTEFRNAYPRELSGGMQQRVAIARSLVFKPSILLMDEPFGAIDPITRSRLQDEFLKIQEKLKKTIVFVTHDINEAIKMGDTIALMRQGRLVQYDDPATLLYNPTNEFVRDFVGADRVLKSLRLHRVSEVVQKPQIIAKTGDDPEEVLPRHLREVDDLPLGHLLRVIEQRILGGHARERVGGHPGGGELFAGEVVGPQIRERDLGRRHVDLDDDVLGRITRLFLL